MILLTVGKVALVTAIAIPILYLLHSRLAGRWLAIEAYPLLLYMSGAFLVMAIMEASLGYMHTEALGWRLWEYRILPNHHGYGTDLGPITWPWYGFHLYLLDQVLSARRLHAQGPVVRGGMTGVDGPLLEILGNGLFLLIFGQYVFYYFPGDLGHLTSLLVIPHYALAGMVLYFIIHALRDAPRSWSLPPALYFTGVCFVVVG
ncbi:MAG: hypothetical protein U5S82_17435 [Gammaproteobacteria bacterium]|nr:hypothetical protein [Gammaproteobacteria bacterium]